VKVVAVGDGLGIYQASSSNRQGSERPTPLRISRLRKTPPACRARVGVFAQLFMRGPSRSSTSDQAEPSNSMESGKRTYSRGFDCYGDGSGCDNDPSSGVGGQSGESVASFGSFRVAKGVRISASSRGLRAHVGPRGARVHLGGGRTGVSTGAGPYTYYTSGGSRGTSRRSGNAGPTKTEIARAEKLAEGTRLQDEIRSIVEIHRVTFPPIRKPDVERPVRPTIDSFLKSREKEQLQEISFFKRAERKQAKERARQLAAADLKHEEARLEALHRSVVGRVDRDWERLIANDPETVMATVEEAFEDNKAPAAPVNVEGSGLNLVVLWFPTSKMFPSASPV